MCGSLLLVASTLTSQAVGQPTRQSIPGTSIELTLVPMPGGVFTMGSPAGEAGRDDDEGPVRQVRLSPFWITAHEVTHDQFGPFRYRHLDTPVTATAGTPFDADAVTRPSPPYEDPSHGMAKGTHPATGMTRLAALRYARWLSEKTGRLFRLPTEAEWEYACRAGRPHSDVEVATLGASAWFEANSAGSYHPIGLKAANPWGLHDLHGNVAEWVMDSYDPEAYSREAGGLLDPLVGDPTRGRGVVRGGAFDDEPARLRCAERQPELPVWKGRDPQIPKSRWWNTDSPHVGFRLVSPDWDYSRQEITDYWNGLLGETIPRDH